MIYKCLILTIILFISSISGITAKGGISAKLIEKQKTSENMSAPQYIGGDSELYKFLESNIRYPYILAQIEMEGEVEVKFTIEKDGEVKNVEIVRGFDPLADDEVMRVVKALPKWSPAKMDEEAIDANLKLVISFTLNDELIAQAQQMKKDGAADDTYIGSSNIQDKVPEKENAESIENVSNDIKDDSLNKAPQFPGGQEALAAYFKNNLKYPKRAIQMKIEGRVIFKLLVSEEGEITKIMLYKSIFRDCDEEAFYLVKKMPKWIPGLKDGNPAAMEVMVPIPFVLPG
ncbi:energy transducer TonB [Dysgonomonas sp. Marseille-P4677]|uniref:energy transducer TonB n=1 Tax=Dysgonomonas sp. Marseille-P4677 TaxID=2364790 RepID=UPI0019141B0F|nr:energy transducer TonB [Dysgonomonas sp. Marseille-P4677]MBK5720565.1 energy transducer TonB [Dysgonomonas sp. Marseille-P4677]